MAERSESGAEIVKRTEESSSLQKPNYSEFISEFAKWRDIKEHLSLAFLGLAICGVDLLWKWAFAAWSDDFVVWSVGFMIAIIGVSSMAAGTMKFLIKVTFNVCRYFKKCVQEGNKK